MTPPVITPDILHNLYNWLYECAHAGSVCPTNQDICERFGFASMATASKAVRILQDRGKITVMRFHRSRQVYIVSTKKLTRLPENLVKEFGYDVPAARATPVMPALRKQADPTPTARRTPKPEKPPRARISPASIQHEPMPQDNDATKRKPPAFRSGHTAPPECKTSDQRAKELAEIAEFEAKGKVKRFRMGATAYEQDENGIYINPKIRKMYQSGLGRVRRASRMSALTRTQNAQK